MCVGIGCRGMSGGGVFCVAVSGVVMSTYVMAVGVLRLKVQGVCFTQPNHGLRSHSIHIVLISTFIQYLYIYKDACLCGVCLVNHI